MSKSEEIRKLLAKNINLKYSEYLKLTNSPADKRNFYKVRKEYRRKIEWVDSEENNRYYLSVLQDTELKEILKKHNDLMYGDYLKIAKYPYKTASWYYHKRLCILGKNRKNRDLHNDLKEVLKSNPDITFSEYKKLDGFRYKYSESRFNMNKRSILDTWGLKKDFKRPTLDNSSKFLNNKKLYNRTNKELNDTIVQINNLWDLLPAKLKRQFRIENYSDDVLRDCMRERRKHND